MPPGRGVISVLLYQPGAPARKPYPGFLLCLHIRAFCFARLRPTFLQHKYGKPPDLRAGGFRAAYTAIFALLSAFLMTAASGTEMMIASTAFTLLVASFVISAMPAASGALPSSSAVTNDFAR